MRVSRVQAEANHQRIIDEASRQFRAHGYDGIGLKDLMKAAGLTQGGFYKQFASKEDLAVQASARAIGRSTETWAATVAANPAAPLSALSAVYLSPAHRDARGRGCPLAALGSDAARHSPEVRAAFEAGIRRHLGILDAALHGAQPVAPSPGAPEAEAGASPASPEAMAALAMMVGALTLARMVVDEGLSGALLDAAAGRLGGIAAAVKPTGG